MDVAAGLGERPPGTVDAGARDPRRHGHLRVAAGSPQRLPASLDVDPRSRRPECVAGATWTSTAEAMADAGFADISTVRAPLPRAVASAARRYGVRPPAVTPITRSPAAHRPLRWEPIRRPRTAS
jgi:hypothetical protein